MRRQIVLAAVGCLAMAAEAKFVDAQIEGTPEQALKEAPYEELRRISSQAAELLKLAEGEKETAQLKSVMISCAKIHRSRNK